MQFAERFIRRPVLASMISVGPFITLPSRMATPGYFLEGLALLFRLFTPLSPPLF